MNLTGRAWFRGFMKRHPELSTRKAQKVSKQRAQITKPVITKWLYEAIEYAEKYPGGKEMLEIREESSTVMKVAFP